jgi:hypothetical protein
MAKLIYSMPSSVIDAATDRGTATNSTADKTAEITGFTATDSSKSQ